MSLADKYFKEAANKILTEGYSDESMQVRPHWEDGTPAHTIKTFCYVCRYDLSKEFPILTLRRQAFKTMIKELLWMWQMKSNNINDVDFHIWDQWADENGSIGKTYSYQLAQKYGHHKIKEGEDLSSYPSAEIGNDGWVYLDQVDGVLYDLKNNPASRRIITNMWQIKDLKDMNLAPCVYETLWDITPDGKLNMTLIQRSGDMCAAAAPGGFDTIEYATLLYLMAHVCGYKPGEFVHIVNNLHIYDRHIDIIKKVCNNPEYDAPKLWINTDKTDFYDFTIDDFKLIDYQSTKLEEKIEVAI